MAQVAMNALFLHNLSSSHLAAHAFLLLAVVCGCLSVYYACVIQRTMGQLYHTDDIRGWLRQPHSNDSTETEIQASLAAVFMIEAPFAMAKNSILFLLFGLGTYQGYVWANSLDPTALSGESRDAFIAFFVIIGVCLLFFILTFSGRFIESSLRKNCKCKQIRHDRQEKRHKYPSKMQTSELTNEHKVTLSQKQEPLPACNTSEEPQVTGLVSALQLAARSHIQCSEADNRVALEYAKLHSS